MFLTEGFAVEPKTSFLPEMVSCGILLPLHLWLKQIFEHAESPAFTLVVQYQATKPYNGFHILSFFLMFLLQGGLKLLLVCFVFLNYLPAWFLTTILLTWLLDKLTFMPRWLPNCILFWSSRQPILTVHATWECFPLMFLLAPSSWIESSAQHKHIQDFL